MVVFLKIIQTTDIFFYFVQLKTLTVNLFENINFTLSGYLCQVREGLLHKLRLFESQQENSKIQTKNSKRLSNAQVNMKKVKVSLEDMKDLTCRCWLYIVSFHSIYFIVIFFQIDKEKEAYKSKNSIPPGRCSLMWNVCFLLNRVKIWFNFIL